MSDNIRGRVGLYYAWAGPQNTREPYGFDTRMGFPAAHENNLHEKSTFQSSSSFFRQVIDGPLREYRDAFNYNAPFYVAWLPFGWRLLPPVVYTEPGDYDAQAEKLPLSELAYANPQLTDSTSQRNFITRIIQAVAAANPSTLFYGYLGRPDIHDPLVKHNRHLAFPTQTLALNKWVPVYDVTSDIPDAPTSTHDIVRYSRLRQILGYNSADRVGTENLGQPDSVFLADPKADHFVVHSTFRDQVRSNFSGGYTCARPEAHAGSIILLYGDPIDQPYDEIVSHLNTYPNVKIALSSPHPRLLKRLAGLGSTSSGLVSATPTSIAKTGPVPLAP